MVFHKKGYLTICDLLRVRIYRLGRCLRYSKAVETGLLHGNLHFTRQFRCLTRHNRENLWNFLNWVHQFLLCKYFRNICRLCRFFVFIDSFGILRPKSYHLPFFPVVGIFMVVIVWKVKLTSKTVKQNGKCKSPRPTGKIEKRGMFYLNERFSYQNRGLTKFRLLPALNLKKLL